MHIYSLASSSKHGNAYVVWEDSKPPLLIDCGLSLRRLVNALEQIGLCPEDLAAMFITHEHSDHVKAMCLKTPFPQKFNVPVFASAGFWKWFEARHRGCIDPSLVHCIGDNQRVEIAGYTVHGFLKPHDAREPMGYRIDGASSSVGFAMDLGHVPPKVENLLRGLEYLVFEANHDVEMEINSGRPGFLIRRVMGRLGHLSNDEAADALTRLVTPYTKQVILSHLSIDCNCPEIATKVVGNELKTCGLEPEIKVAPACGVWGFGVSGFGA